MAEEHARASSEEVEYVSNFRVNHREFVSTKVQYANLPYVSFDGQAVHLTFLTWSLPPGASGSSDDNQVSVTARIAMPRESAQLLAKLLEEVGVAPLPAEASGHDDDQN